jgi:epoxyqueuosine reductase
MSNPSYRCVSYLTIELHGSIPEELRPLIGNRVYGCDDCQLVCPWNRFARLTEKDFHPRHRLNSQQLMGVFAWTEQEFLAKTEGSAIRRIGYERWLRNIAVALGNAPKSERIVEVLKTKLQHPSSLCGRMSAGRWINKIVGRIRRTNSLTLRNSRRIRAP